MTDLTPLGHISEYGLDKLMTRRHYCVSVSHQAEKEYTIAIVTLSSAATAISEKDALIANQKKELERLADDLSKLAYHLAPDMDEEERLAHAPEQIIDWALQRRQAIELETKLAYERSGYLQALEKAASLAERYDPTDTLTAPKEIAASIRALTNDNCLQDNDGDIAIELDVSGPSSRANLSRPWLNQWERHELIQYAEAGQDMPGYDSAEKARWKALEDKLSKFSLGQYLLTKKHRGMKIDYRGMLASARHGLRREPMAAEMLAQLEEHLTELGQRWYTGDIAVVDELLQLYCVQKDARTQLENEVSE